MPSFVSQKFGDKTIKQTNKPIQQMPKCMFQEVKNPHISATNAAPFISKSIQHLVQIRPNVARKMATVRSAVTG